MEENETPEAPLTPVQQVQAMTAKVRREREWALAKATSIETRIVEAGGMLTVELREAMDELRAECGEATA